MQGAQGRYLCSILGVLAAAASTSAQDKQDLGYPAGEPEIVTCSGDATQLRFPLDATYSLVDFFGDGATGNRPATGPDQHNDDDSATLPLPFTFNLYGDTYTTAYVNNNGNISFGTHQSQYTPGLPSSVHLVAPFWADVDTGDLDNFIGDVWQKLYNSDGDGDVDTLVVTWADVGYFNQRSNLRNTFQVAISDGSNPAMGLGNNVCFSWGNMCWTTGGQSGGTNGFGGTPATVGVNRGNGVQYFQIGLFDHPGIDYDGPLGNQDGVSFLDGSLMCFSTAATSNIRPIVVQRIPATSQFTVFVGEAFHASLRFITPEAGQSISVVASDPDGAQAAGLVIGNNSPSQELRLINLDWTPDCADLGQYTLQFTATDSFNPPGQTTVSLEVNVVAPPNPPSTIHVAWAELPPPSAPADYVVLTPDPAYPNIQLLKGSPTWRVWSTNLCRADGLGDIGTISTPVAEDFVVAIRNETQPGFYGARHIKSISLAPLGSTHQGSIGTSTIEGDLQDLSVKATASGTGGEVDGLYILGGVTGNVNVHRLQNLYITSALSGTLYVDELAGSLTVGEVLPSGTISVAHDMEGYLEILRDMEGTLVVHGDIEPPASVSIGTTGGTHALTGNIRADGNIAGSLFVDGAVGPEAEIIADADGPNEEKILGNVTVTGLFNGNICGQNLTSNAPLPFNIDVASWGASGKVCGDIVCQTLLAAPVAEPSLVAKNRFVSFLPPQTQGLPVAIRVRMASMPQPFGESRGRGRYVGPIGTYSEGPYGTFFTGAGLQCDPYYLDWTVFGTIHAFGVEVVPGATYEVRAESGTCQSAKLTIGTGKWGDVVAPFGAMQPNFSDVSAIIDKFSVLPTAVSKTRAMLQPNRVFPVNDVNFLDISACVAAFRGFPYPFAGPDDDCQ